ncbi:MAG: HAMP domain-containing protein [Candidatus Andersenbacteria bacterium]|nr:HAMP domain-containing protein [Candidatus Andersenbacteria bacterium]
MMLGRRGGLNIRARLLLGFGTALLLVVAFGVYLLGSLAITSRSLALLKRGFAVHELISGLEADRQALLAATRALLATQDLTWERVYDEKSARVDEQLRRLKEIVAAKETAQLVIEYELVARQLQGVELLIVARVAEGDVARAHELFDASYEERQAQATVLLSQALVGERLLLAETVERTNRLLRSVGLLFWTVLAVVLAGAAVWLTRLVRHITRVVRELLAAAAAVAAGDLGRRVVVRSGDEFGQLGAHFNRMARSLQQMLLARDRQRKQLLVQNLELEGTTLRLEEAVKHLQQIDAAKSDFVSVAAHQLRSPLTGINWTLHALSQEAERLTPEQDKLVRDAAHATDRLVALVNDLLSVARLEEGRLGLEKVKQSLSPMLEDAKRRFAAAARGKGVQLMVHLPAQLPAVDIDRVRMVVVLDNLLDNAIKYTPPGGTVTLEGQASEGEVTVLVKDTGIGIPRDEWSRVFTKFFRSENAQLAKTSGTGLGLFVAKKVIEQHGGRMWFHSVENEGSSFAFALPRAGRKKN